MKYFITLFVLILSITIALLALKSGIFTFINPSFLDTYPLSLSIICFFETIILLLISIPFIWFFTKKLNPQSFFSKTSKIAIPILLISSFVLASLFIFSFNSNQKTFPNDTVRLVVIGLDGATWDLIEPWMQRDELINIHSFYKQGAYGELKSLETMRSPSLWTTICTGQSPKNHGVEGFFSTRSDLCAPRVWDIAQANGQSVGLYGWLVSEAYLDPFAFVIPGWLARTAETVPPRYVPVQEIRLEQGAHAEKYQALESILASVGAGVRASTFDQLLYFYTLDYFGLSEEERLARKQLAEVDLHTDAFLHALRNHKPNVAAFSLYGTDKLAHRFWHYMRPQDFENMETTTNTFLKNALFRYYQKADRAIGRIVSKLPEDCTVILLSDHGMKADTALSKRYFLNTPALLGALNAESLVSYANLPGETQLSLKTNDAEEIASLLKSLHQIKWPEGHEPVFRIQANEDGTISVRSNFSMSWHEDSPILMNPFLKIGEQKISSQKLFHLRTFSANHDRDGIVLFKGPNIQPGRLATPASLYDIAPTLLYLLDLPISQELPGQIVQEAIDKEYFNSNPPHYVEEFPPLQTTSEPPGRPMDSLYERLQSVGYVD